MKRVNLIEIVAFVLYLAAFAISVGAFPLPWMNEVHIIEMGRACLGVDASESVFLMSPQGANFAPFYFIGPTNAHTLANFKKRLMEMGFRRVSVVSFEDCRRRVPDWFAPFEPFVQSVRGCDDFVIWRRK